MKKLSLVLVVCLLIGLAGCCPTQSTPQILATTKPVYDFTTELCSGTDLSVGLLINDSVSCLHDYSLSVSQVRNVEAADMIVLSGAGLEEFMEDLLASRSNVIDSSKGITLSECEEEHDHDHHHEVDAHIWLSPVYAKQMAKNICDGLCSEYPQYTEIFCRNYREFPDGRWSYDQTPPRHR